MKRSRRSTEREREKIDPYLSEERLGLVAQIAFSESTFGENPPGMPHGVRRTAGSDYG